MTHDPQPWPPPRPEPVRTESLPVESQPAESQPTYPPPVWPAQPSPTYPTAYPPAYPTAFGPAGPTSRGTDGFAVTSLVLGALGGGLLAVGFGWAALNRIRRTGRPGRGLAVAGIVLSVVWMVVGAVVAGVVIRSSQAATAARPTGAAVGRTSGQVALTDLRVGDCVSQDLGGADSSTATVVPCTQGHHGEVFHLGRAAEASAYPGEPALRTQAEGLCSTAAASNLVSGLPDDAEMVYSYPRPLGWSSGDRVITCLVNTPGTASTVEMVNAGSQ